MGTLAAGHPSHAEREAAVARLSDAYSRGELTLADFTQALDRAYAAATADELDALRPALPSPLDVDGSRFAAHLLPGEHIYWTGGPDPRRHFTPADWFAVPFSVLWASFAVFWEAAAIASGPSFFMLWGIPFVAVGLYVTVGRFLRKAWLRRRTHYALTNLRALELVERGGMTELEAVFLETVPAVNELVSGGNGTIVFGNARPRDVYLWDSAGGLGQSRSPIPLTFFDIPDAPRVLELAGRFRAEAIPEDGRGSV